MRTAVGSSPSARRSSGPWNRPGRLTAGNGTRCPARRAVKGVAYNFAMRFGDEPGTNPEELVAAAHAACFSMALSNELGQAGYRPEVVETKATLDFDKTDKGWSVKSIHLDVS